MTVSNLGIITVGSIAVCYGRIQVAKMLYLQAINMTSPSDPARSNKPRLLWYCEVRLLNY